MPHSLFSELTLAFKRALEPAERQENSEKLQAVQRRHWKGIQRRAVSGGSLRGVNVIPASRVPT